METPNPPNIRANQWAFVRPSVGTSNAEELIFDRIDLGYIVAVASGEGTGRSATAQLLHASEVAFWDDLPIQMAALMQTVPDLPGTEIILETTANGHNDLHSLWFVDPEYRREIDADFVMDADESKLAGNDGSAPTIPRQGAHAHALGAVLARRSSVSPSAAVLAFFCRLFNSAVGRWPRLGRMYAGRGHPIPSTCESVDQKKQFDRDQFFLTATDTAFWEA
jgi:hypothetical protein